MFRPFHGYKTRPRSLRRGRQRREVPSKARLVANQRRVQWQWLQALPRTAGESFPGRAINHSLPRSHEPTDRHDRRALVPPFRRTQSFSFVQSTHLSITPPPPAPVAAENRFASSLLIWSSGLSFWVAFTNERTEALSGAFFSLSKLDGPGFDVRSECRNTFNSRYFAGFQRRNASICCAGEPGAT